MRRSIDQRKDCYAIPSETREQTLCYEIRNRLDIPTDKNCWDVSHSFLPVPTSALVRFSLVRPWIPLACVAVSDKG